MLKAIFDPHQPPLGMYRVVLTHHTSRIIVPHQSITDPVMLVDLFIATTHASYMHPWVTTQNQALAELSSSSVGYTHFVKHWYSIRDLDACVMMCLTSAYATSDRYLIEAPFSPVNSAAGLDVRCAQILVQIAQTFIQCMQPYIYQGSQWDWAAALRYRHWRVKFSLSLKPARSAVRCNRETKHVARV